MFEIGSEMVNKTLIESYLESIQCKCGCTFYVSLWMKPYCVTIQMKAMEQYFHVVLFVFDNFAK